VFNWYGSWKGYGYPYQRFVLRMGTYPGHDERPEIDRVFGVLCLGFFELGESSSLG
jgi:hypothetical protein